MEQYQQSLAIKEKIGDINGAAISLGQIGKVLSIKGDHANGLKHCLQSLSIFLKIGSPNAEIVKGMIAKIREKLPPEQFEAVLQELGVPADAFDEAG